MKLKLLLLLFLIPTTLPAQQPTQQAKAIPPPPGAAQAKPMQSVTMPKEMQDEHLFAYHRAYEAQILTGVAQQNVQMAQQQLQAAQKEQEATREAYLELERRQAKALGLPESTQFTVDISKDSVSAPGQNPQPAQAQVKN